MMEKQPIEKLRHDIDRLDHEILEAIKARTEISQAIGRIRRNNGGARIDPKREQIIYERYSELGDAGEALADILLQLGRGKIT